MEFREFLKNHPFIKILIPLCTGIILQNLFSFNFSIYFGCGAVLLFFLLAAFMIKSKSMFSEWRNGIAIFMLFLTTGVFITFQTENRINNFKLSESENLHFVLVKYNPEIKEKTVKTTCTYIADTNQISSTNNGLCSISIERDTNSENIRAGDLLLIRARFEKIQGPKNPNEFDYKNFLYKKGITYQTYVNSVGWEKIGESKKLFTQITDFQKKLRDVFFLNGVSGAELSVASALVLGDKTLLEKDLKLAFSHAGAIHVLAVSGLHVGIIYLVLNLLLSFLNKFKRGKYIKAVIIILFLWFYAMLTGMSPSVLRSATMFSFVTAGSSFSRKVSVYNSLSASAFLLLCFNPFLLTDVGFQLSYLAVFSIVFFQSKIYGIFYFKNKLADKVWALTTVSIAAQLGTTPISLYYFNQFPNMFFLTNLIVIPLAAVILYLAFLLFVFSFIPLVNEALGWLLSNSAKIMIEAVSVVEGIPFSYSSGIYISVVQTICFYGIIILLSTYTILQRKWMIFSCLFLAIFFFADSGLRRIDQDKQQFLTIYSTRGNTLINFTDGRKSCIFTDSLSVPIEKYDFQTKNHIIYSGINELETFSLSETEGIINEHIKKTGNFIIWNNKVIFRLNDKTPIPDSPSVKTKLDFIIVSGNAYYSSEKLDSVFEYEKIILDGSVKKYIAEKWLQTPGYSGKIHYVEIDKAFVFDL